MNGIVIDSSMRPGMGSCCSTMTGRVACSSDGGGSSLSTTPSPASQACPPAPAPAERRQRRHQRDQPHDSHGMEAHGGSIHRSAKSGRDHADGYRGPPRLRRGGPNVRGSRAARLSPAARALGSRAAPAPPGGAMLGIESRPGFAGAARALGGLEGHLGPARCGLKILNMGRPRDGPPTPQRSRRPAKPGRLSIPNTRAAPAEPGRLSTPNARAARRSRAALDPDVRAAPAKAGRPSVTIRVVAP